MNPPSQLGSESARVLRALLSGVGYAVLGGMTVLVAFLAWFRMQPTDNAFAGLAMWFAAALVTFAGFVLGVLVSVRSVTIVRRLPGVAWLDRRGGIPALLVLGALVSWGAVEVGAWLQTSPPAPRVTTTVEIPFNADLGVGIARVGISLTGQACVGFYHNTVPHDAAGYHTGAHALATPDSTDTCNGLTSPVAQTALAVMYDDLDDSQPPPSSGTVLLQFTFPDEVAGAFGEVTFPSSAPRIVRLPPLHATVELDSPTAIWRVRVEEVGGGFAVPLVALSDQPESVSFSLSEITEHGNRANTSARGEGPIWSMACESPACERGWYLSVSRDTVEPQDQMHDVTVHLVVWVFDSDTEASVVVESCQMTDSTPACPGD